MSENSIPPELIEKFRQTGIRLDREGRFWHEGAEITHERFRKTLLRWLDVLEDGRPILRLDETRYAYVDVDDAMLLVTSIQWRDNRAYLRLNDESEEELEYDTLAQADDHALYCNVRAGRLLARITTPAYYQLAEHVEELDEGFALRAAGGLHPIGKR
jgi:hypothetical protein